MRGFHLQPPACLPMLKVPRGHTCPLLVTLFQGRREAFLRKGGSVSRTEQHRGAPLLVQSTLGECVRNSTGHSGTCLPGVIWCPRYSEIRCMVVGRWELRTGVFLLENCRDSRPQPPAGVSITHLLEAAPALWTGLLLDHQPREPRGGWSEGAAQTPLH